MHGTLICSLQVLLAPSMDALRKPDPGMWHFLANRLNSGVPIGARSLCCWAMMGMCLPCSLCLPGLTAFVPVGACYVPVDGHVACQASSGGMQGPACGIWRELCR